MIFSNKIYPKQVAQMILAKEKTQTRRIVKEGDYEVTNPTTAKGITHVVNSKLKWQVGRDYAVQLGRGKKGLWYCPKCKGISPTSVGVCWCENELVPDLKPLRIKITNIHKENLLDITETDAKKEGFQNTIAFFTAFTMLTSGTAIKNNPKVWVIEFKPKEALP